MENFYFFGFYAYTAFLGDHPQVGTDQLKALFLKHGYKKAQSSLLFHLRDHTNLRKTCKAALSGPRIIFNNESVIFSFFTHGAQGGFDRNGNPPFSSDRGPLHYLRKCCQPFNHSVCIPPTYTKYFNQTIHGNKQLGGTPNDICYMSSSYKSLNNFWLALDSAIAHEVEANGLPLEMVQEKSLVVNYIKMLKNKTTTIEILGLANGYSPASNLLKGPSNLTAHQALMDLFGHFRFAIDDEEGSFPCPRGPRDEIWKPEFESPAGIWNLLNAAYQSRMTHFTDMDFLFAIANKMNGYRPKIVIILVLPALQANLWKM